MTETELDDIRKKRQEEWEKVRKEDDPLGKSSMCLMKAFPECKQH